MFGYLRLFLALMVLFSHIKINIFGFNMGVMAVIIFYILAGFVISQLYHKIFINKSYSFYALLKDRILRIYPLYLYALIICMAFVFISDYHKPVFEIPSILAHIFIIPLNYYMFFDWSILQNPKSQLNELAWSLGAELQAYILLALTFYFPLLRSLFFISSAIIFICAISSIIDTNIFAYRLVGGVLFIFIIGTMIERTLHSSKHYYKWILSVFCAIIVFIIVQRIGHFVSIGTYGREVLLGILFGIPLVFYIAQYKKSLPFNNFCGSLSYGIFLTHTPSYWILEYLGFLQSNAFIFLLLSLCIFIALIGIFFIEKPINTYRIQKLI